MRVYCIGIPSKVVGDLLSDFDVEVPVAVDAVTSSLRSAFVEDAYDAVVVSSTAPRADAIANLARAKGARVVWVGQGGEKGRDDVAVETGLGLAGRIAAALGLTKRRSTVFVPVVSGKGGVGKSTLAAYLATLIALRSPDERVLIVDDSTLRQIAGFFRLQAPRPSDVTGRPVREIILDTNIPNLNVLPVIPHSGSTGGTVRFSTAVNILQELQDEGYTVVVVDVRPEPPLPRDFNEMTQVSLSGPLILTERFPAIYVVPYTPDEMGRDGALMIWEALGERTRWGIPVIVCTKPDHIPETVPKIGDARTVVVGYDRRIALNRTVVVGMDGRRGLLYRLIPSASKVYDKIVVRVMEMVNERRERVGHAWG